MTSAWKKAAKKPSPWTPFRLISKEAGTDGEGLLYENNRYRVIRRPIGIAHPIAGQGEIKGWWLSIHNLKKTADHDWRDYQRIKNELVGPEAEGVELYPAESRLVDTSNQFHLYVFEGFQF